MIISMKISLSMLLVTTMLLLPGSSQAVQKVYKYDQFQDDVVTAGSQISGAPTFVSPGFAGGEAFGQIFKPAPGEYPVKIKGLDLYFAAPPKGNVAGTPAIIEMWFTDGNGPDPGTDTPTFSIDTTNLFDPNTGEDGLILTGETAIQIEFDWSDVKGHPPLLLSGNVIVLVRFKNSGLSLETEWNQSNCIKEYAIGYCGCQPIGTISDNAITPEANVMHVTVGGCSFPAGKWAFAESFGIKGDFVFRMIADVTSTCTGSCAGKSCGTDGCGGSCGTCGSGLNCVQGQCVDTGGGTGGCTSSCDFKQCGDDGCGGVCGVCSADTVCSQGICIPSGDDGGGSDGTVCEPDCGGKLCGPDGCGDVCGTCIQGLTCDSGQCANKQRTLPGGDVVVLEVSPASGLVDEQTPISIIGSGFSHHAEVRAGGNLLIAIQVLGSELITATVPKGISPGFYSVIVSNEDGSSGHLKNAFEVRKPEEQASSSGCVVGKRSTGTGTIVFVFLLMLALIRRVTRARAAQSASN